MTPVLLTETEHKRLDHLYGSDGAWTIQEALDLLGEERLTLMLNRHILGTTDTSIGTMLILLSAGRELIYGTVSRAVSLNSQVDTAYRRLVMAERGWTWPSDPRFQHLITHTHAAELETEFGRALVWAKVNGDGHTLPHMKRVAEKYRSSALGDGFMVVFVSPSQSGETFAEANKNHVREVQHRPVIPKALLPTLLIDDEITPDGPYIAGTGWHTHQLLTTLPPATHEVLRSERDVRVRSARAALSVDGALTTYQLERYFGLKPNDIPGIKTVSRTIRMTPTHKSHEVAVTFVSLSERVLRLNPSRIGHLTGTAEMRLRMGIPADPARYKIDTGASRYNERPDGLYTRPDGVTVALEYDNGTYKKPLIERKLDSFRTSQCDIIWGVTSHVRARHMTDLFRNQLSHDVLILDWAGPPPT